MKVYPPGIQKIIPHSNHLVIVRAEGADLLDPMTGQWQHFPSQRTAKWSATVYSRLRQGFGHHVASQKRITSQAEAIVRAAAAQALTEALTSEAKP